MKGVEEWMATYLFANQLLGLRESRNCQHGAIRMKNAAHLPPSSLSLRADEYDQALSPQVTMATAHVAHLFLLALHSSSRLALL
jgi:hypothetical protein